MIYIIGWCLIGIISALLGKLMLDGELSFSDLIIGTFVGCFGGIFVPFIMFLVFLIRKYDSKIIFSINNNKKERKVK